MGEFTSRSYINTKTSSGNVYYLYSAGNSTLNCFAGTIYMNSTINGLFKECTRFKYNWPNPNYDKILKCNYYEDPYENIHMVFETALNSVSTFYNCQNITGNFVQTPNSSNCSYMFYNCSKLNGAPYCSDKVTDTSYMYYKCNNITGKPVVGNSVTNMSNMYYDCGGKLTGAAAVGSKVENMSYGYYNCFNLATLPSIQSTNLQNIAYAFYNCQNITGNLNLYGNIKKNINAENAFYNHNNNYRINLYVNEGSYYDQALYQQNIGGKVFGSSVTIKWSTLPGVYYNKAYNIYVYNDINGSIPEDTSPFGGNVYLNYFSLQATSIQQLNVYKITE